MREKRKNNLFPSFSSKMYIEKKLIKKINDEFFYCFKSTDGALKKKS